MVLLGKKFEQKSFGRQIEKQKVQSVETRRFYAERKKQVLRLRPVGAPGAVVREAARQ